SNAFLRKPIWFPEIDRLVMVVNNLPGQSGDRNSVSPADYLAWKAESRSFEKMGAYEWSDVNLTGNGDPQKLAGANVTANFFDILQISPQLGRAFLPDEEQPGHDQEVILGHGLWVRQFGSDANILGKKVTIDGVSDTVVGVMGDDFDFPTSVQVWLPMTLSDKEKTIRTDHYVWPAARLRPGVPLEQAQAEMAAIQGRIQKDFPSEEKGWDAQVLPISYFVSDRYSRQYSMLLLVAVGFVLLIACANVANVQLARATARHKEFAVREAIGASRWRIIRQLLTESILLSLAGAAVGLLLANWAIKLVVSNMPPDVARYIAAWKHIQLDLDVFVYTIAIAVIAGVVSGLAPAFQGAKLDLSEQLKEGGRGGMVGKSRHLFRNALVVGEIAASLLLLVGAGLTVTGVRALLRAHQNLLPESLLTMRVTLPDSKYIERPQQREFYSRVLEQLNASPGVKAASVATDIPFGDEGMSDSFRVEGIPSQPGEIRFATINSVNPEFFHTMNIPLRDGRVFSDQDGADAPPVVVISERLARRFWPSESAVGKRVQSGAESSGKPWATVVGVVGDIRYKWMDEGNYPVIYFPYRQAPHQSSYIAVRAQGDPRAIVPAVRAVIAAVDPDQPIYEIKTLDRVISESVVGLSYVAVMMGVLGLIALVLAAVGVYGVMAYAVAERTHEIGVRLALGAQPREIMRLILSRGVFLLALGLAIGLPISYAFARLLASLIFGVSSTDAGVFSLITIFLAAISLAACYIPAHRAMSVDPIVALRYE
ncbi:MAG TPA: ABC transporter permease, partial [Terriglobales bacterium]|nr:ABC transporter permease [Terriglobales bacterium]